MLTVPRKRQPLPNVNAFSRAGILDGYPDVLNVEHLCEITGLSAPTIREAIKSGELPGVRIGRRLFVTKQMFIEFLMGRGAHV